MGRILWWMGASVVFRWGGRGGLAEKRLGGWLIVVMVMGHAV